MRSPRPGDEASVYLDGTSNILVQPEFDDVGRMRALFQTFEEKSRLVKILNACIAGDGIRVLIGHENPDPELRDLSLVTASCRVEGEPGFGLGVLGSTRMEYAHVVSPGGPRGAGGVGDPAGEPRLSSEGQRERRRPARDRGHDRAPREREDRPPPRGRVGRGDRARRGRPLPTRSRRCAKERDDLKDALLRRRAEFENYRRRVERDRGSAAAEAEAGILRQLLGTVDNLERALGRRWRGLGPARGRPADPARAPGRCSTRWASRLAPVGESFDPALHQAILHEPAPGFEAGTVVEVYRKGYTYKDRLLRPALVKVASAGHRGAGRGDGGDVQ